MPTLSVVIPAYNEQESIAQTLASIPVRQLEAGGLDVEVLVVDNGSTDSTGRLARQHGARVIVQPVRGYGNAYKAGFANCTGDVIATGDADLTYPFGILPDAVRRLDADRLDFLSTNRLQSLDPAAMSRSHVWGNRVLSRLTHLLFRLPFGDSQSGMWVFRRHVLADVRVASGGMAFSQELKVEVFRRGFRCAELPIAYQPRAGHTKLRPVRDGLGNIGQLIASRLRARERHAPLEPVGLRAATLAPLLLPATPAPLLLPATPVPPLRPGTPAQLAAPVAAAVPESVG
jgi:glycosyltransferase involved in cell wall biosynthesis